MDDLGGTDIKQPLSADMYGVSLHAAVRCSADDRHELKQLSKEAASKGAKQFGCTGEYAERAAAVCRPLVCQS